MKNIPSAYIPLAIILSMTCGALTPPCTAKAAVVLAAQDEKRMTPEQSRALTEALQLMAHSSELQRQGKLDEAAGLREQAQTIIEKTFGTEHFASALNLKLLAFLYDQKGDYRKAEAAYLRALAAQEKLTGPEHAEVADVLIGLGTVYGHMEDFVRAEQVYTRALAIREKALGPDSTEVASALFSLSHAYTNRGLYGQAEPLLRRALAIQEKALGPDTLEVALTLNNLAYLYMEKGDFEQSEALFKRSLATFEKLLGPEHTLVGTPLNSLAALYRTKGDYQRAEPLLKRALAIQEKAVGPLHPDTANALNSLALLYSEKGDDERALPLFQRALAIREKAEPDSSSVAATLNSIANVYSSKGEHEQATSLYKRALAIVEKTIGTETPLYASTLSNLAVVYAEQGDYAQAEPLIRQALALREKLLGPDHPDVAVTLSNLAYIYFAKNEFEKEEPLYLRALAITEKAYGPDHPNLGLYLANLATVYWGRGDKRQALAALTRNAELRERNLALVLTAGSEEQKRLYMATLANETDGLISFHTSAAPSDPAAAELALTTILRRKGRVLDVMSDQVGVLRRRLDAQDRALLDRLSATRSALARLVLQGADAGRPAERREEEKRLKDELDLLEAKVSERSAEFRTQAQPVTLKAVREAIPADAALVEFVVYRPYDVMAANRKSKFGAPRYVAYVLRRTGAPQWVDLGDAESVERSVAAWRRTLIDPSNQDVSRSGRALDEIVMRPVRKLLGDARHIFLSPDGALNLIPFGALVDERNRYLLEDYSMTYLTSGRDLLRLQLSVGSREGPLVVANPLFEAGAPEATVPAASAAQAAQNRRSADFASSVFTPLPGTKGEAKALGAILTGARVFTDAQASEALIKHVNGPSILHIATHGFFLPDQPLVSVDTAQAESRGMALLGGGDRGRVEGENPLLRSGLALAGANRGQGGEGEDGVLTALEAAGLDLRGTKLVVLSACETGVGEVKNGDGVYGLRRALVLAGAESQVMSLWQVSDEATRDLMIGYYKRLQAGEGRTEALRAVQLEMLKGGRDERDAEDRNLSTKRRGQTKQSRSHPFFWSSFIQSGDWRSMNNRVGENE
jgi:CHAT domain-containing protein/Tfp pilus assembly protein PilF